MILIYRPDGGAERRWDLSEEQATFAEAKAAEAAGGFPWVRVHQELVEGNLAALQAALWVYRRREEPELKFEDLDDLPLSAASAEYSPPERAAMRAQIMADPTMPEAVRAATLAALGIDGEDEGEDAGAGGQDPDPKDQTPEG